MKHQNRTLSNDGTKTGRKQSPLRGGWKTLRVQFGEIYIKEMRLMAKLMGWNFRNFVEYALRQTHREILRDYFDESESQNRYGCLMLSHMSPSELKKKVERFKSKELVERKMCKCGLN